MVQNQIRSLFLLFTGEDIALRCICQEEIKMDKTSYRTLT